MRIQPLNAKVSKDSEDLIRMTEHQKYLCWKGSLSLEAILIEVLTRIALKNEGGS